MSVRKAGSSATTTNTATKNTPTPKAGSTPSSNGHVPSLMALSVNSTASCAVSIGADADSLGVSGTGSWVQQTRGEIPRVYNESDPARAFSVAYDVRHVKDVSNPKMRTLVRTSFQDIRQGDLVMTAIVGQLRQSQDRMVVSSWVKDMISKRWADNANADIKNQVDAAVRDDPRGFYEVREAFTSKWTKTGTF